MDSKKREELDLRTSSIIYMSLANNILVKVLGTSETLSFEEVAGKIIYEERIMKGEDNNSSNSVLVARGRPCVKKHNETGAKCWKYGKITHVKCKCSDWAMLEKVSESNANNVSLTLGDDDLL
ncbi:hypothetical protein KIW84_050631 [Lathyrus oleraceus]|uniref:Uncharacterized protein n=1 Tax=Pisum sativum TaxID=3888 RepID=A0A9D5ACM5_PEA|nr:hypothetical protein KIW84_050631 [Pisum sativum]